MGTAASLQNRPLNLLDCVNHLLSVIAPGKEISCNTNSGHSIQVQDEANNLEGNYRTWGESASKGSRKILTEREAEDLQSSILRIFNCLRLNPNVFGLHRVRTEGCWLVKLSVRDEELFNATALRNQRILRENLENLEREVNGSFFYLQTLTDYQNTNPFGTIANEERNITVEKYHNAQAIIGLEEDIKSGNPDNVDLAIDWLSKRGFSIAKIEEQISPLRFAIAVEANVEMIRHLIEGVGFHLTVTGNSTNLTHAIECGNPEAVRYLFGKYEELQNPEIDNLHKDVALKTALSSLLTTHGLDSAATLFAAQDKIVSFFLQKEFTLDEESRKNLKGDLRINESVPVSDLTLFTLYKAVETVRELATKISFADIIDTKNFIS